MIECVIGARIVATWPNNATFPNAMNGPGMFAWGVVMNQKQRELIIVIMEMIHGTLDMMEKDVHHAPAPWLLENWWATLNAVLKLSESHLDSES